jgi:hypothetical protein
MSKLSRKLIESPTTAAHVGKSLRYSKILFQYNKNEIEKLLLTMGKHFKFKFEDLQIAASHLHVGERVILRTTHKGGSFVPQW